MTTNKDRRELAEKIARHIFLGPPVRWNFAAMVEGIHMHLSNGRWVKKPRKKARKR
mgnify:CR=1 FL=1